MDIDKAQSKIVLLQNKHICANVFATEPDLPDKKPNPVKQKEADPPHRKKPRFFCSGIKFLF